MLNQLDIFKVRVISELVKTESLLQSAKNLRVTSSAISQNIKNLENSIGRPLFVRVGKSMKPTTLALEIEKASKPYFATLMTILENSNEKVYSLQIAAPVLFGSTILLDKLEHIRVKHPGLQISITLSVTNKILEELVNGKLDFGFVDSGPHTKTTKTLYFTPCFSEELVLCCSRDFFKSHLKNGHSLKILKTLPHIPYHLGKEGVYKWYQHHYQHMPDINWTFSIDSPYGILNAILKGWGLGVITKGLAREHLNKLYIIPGLKSECRSEILLAQNLSKIPSKIEKDILKFILKN